MTLNIISTWWRMGEEDAVAVYRLGFRRLFTELVLGCLLLCLFWALTRRHWTGLVIVGAVWFGIRMLAEGRRAIIFSPDSIKIRPPFLSPRTIRLGDVSQIREGHVLSTFNGVIRFNAGVNVVLKDGDIFGIPLDFPDRKEIIRRIQVAASTRN